MNRGVGKVLIAALAALGLALGAGSPAWSQMPSSLGVGTNPQGSLFYSIGSAVAKVLSGHLPVQARVQPYAGTSVVLPLIDSGELALGVNNTNDSRMAYRGLKPFLPTPHLRLVTVLLQIQVGMMVPARSDMHTLADLKGKRVSGEFNAQLAVWYNTTSILASAGMGWKDVEMVPTPNVVTGAKALMEGRVDSTLFALGAAQVREADASISGGIRFLPIINTPEGVRRMQEAMPGTYPVVVKKGSTVGIHEDTPVEGYDVFLITNDKLSDEAVATIVKALYEAEKEVQGSFRPLHTFARDQMVKDNVTIPYHPGAVKAYKELGLWSAGMDAVQARLLSEAVR
jgi:uncharacterized protein